MSTSPAASVVVVNYNGAGLLPELFAHLERQTTRDFELIVVDNGSSDSSPAIIAETGGHYPVPIRIIRNARNLGFGPATNQGIRRSASAWVATLNNDTLPEPTYLERLLEAAAAASNSGARTGMVGAKMLRAHDPSQIDSAGISVDRAGIAWDRRGGQQDDAGETSPQALFGPCAGAAVYSRAMLNEIGLFDEDFFAYMEDVDLAWRARLAGWHAILQPRARVLHAHSATLGDASPRKRYLLARNKVWMLVKNYPSPDIFRQLPTILAYDSMATLYGVATRADFASLRGRVAALRRLQPFLEKRREIQSRWHDVENWRQAVSSVEWPWAVPARYSHLRSRPAPAATARRQR